MVDSAAEGRKLFYGLELWLLSFRFSNLVIPFHSSDFACFKIVFRYLQRKSTQLTKFWEESKKQTIVTCRSSQIWSLPWTGSGELPAVFGTRGLILRCSGCLMSLGLKSTSSNSPAGEWQNSLLGVWRPHGCPVFEQSSHLSLELRSWGWSEAQWDERDWPLGPSSAV